MTWKPQLGQSHVGFYSVGVDSQVFDITSLGFSTMNSHAVDGSLVEVYQKIP